MRRRLNIIVNKCDITIRILDKGKKIIYCVVRALPKIIYKELAKIAVFIYLERTSLKIFSYKILQVLWAERPSERVCFYLSYRS
ncbi:hypothetical protein GGP41_002719 [Bipolaris sorokiniana]|uniref:Uncharacterized protein n=1 Tax=Cochliobolus sativus TaxID=45130 RepID=A0A8H5ZJK5_COCSA|nr:hypothetical protein GGP41_002719 [Bipolaris sorokiniana]